MRLASFASLALLAAGSAFANPIDQIRPDAPELAPYGPQPIGVQTLEFVHPGQIDILNTTADSAPLYDRPLKAEVWYPAAAGTEPGGEYRAFLRDGQTEVTLTGRAARDAPPASGSYPLIVISHGYPGNRFLLSHLGENLASKGYVTVSIDHTDSTYSDQGAFGSTLLNRPIDQRFVVDQMQALQGPLGAVTDASRVGLIGYSMGGYGALIYGGAGVTQASTEYSWGTPNGLLARHLAGSETHEALANDPRIKAVIAIGPWGKNAGFWDAMGMADFRKPLLLVAGGADDVSGYDAMRTIFVETTSVTRHLLTFDHANHNAAAPMPAPREAWEPVESLDFVPFEHYADAVWDNVRMNNILQHFATAFMDLHVKGDAPKAAYLDLIERSGDGVVALDDAGKPTDDHSYWRGFAPRTAAGLRFETRTAEE